jgi:hypothetical protein
MDMNALVNGNHTTLTASGDRWVVVQRNAILDWYKEEMLKEKYEGASDRAMLNEIALAIAVRKEEYPGAFWDRVTEEVAEGLLDMDEWEMGHYEIEEYLLDKVYSM